LWGGNEKEKCHSEEVWLGVRGCRYCKEPKGGVIWIFFFLIQLKNNYKSVVIFFNILICFFFVFFWEFIDGVCGLR